MAALGAVLALVVLLGGKSTPAAAIPNVGGFLVNGLATAQNVNVGSTAVVNGSYTDEGVTPNFVLTSSAAATIGYFIPGRASVVPGFNNDGTQVITGNSPTVPTVITVTDDTDVVVENTAVQAFFYCASAGTTNLSFIQGGGTSAVIAITCVGATTTISFSNAAPAVGVAVTVTATCAGASQPLTSSPTTSGAFGTTGITIGTWVSATQVNCNAAGTMMAPYTCALPGTVTFTLNGITNTLVCGTTTTTGLVLSATSGVSATVTGTCTTGILLTQTGAAYFTGATLNGITVTTGVVAGSIPCSGAGTIIATLVCNSVGNVSIALGAATANFYCQAGNTGYPGYTGGYNPYLNAYPTTCGTTGYNTGAYPYNNGYNTGVYPYNNGYNTGAYPYNNGYNTGVYPYNNTQYAGTNNCGYNQQQYTNVPTSLTIATASPSVSCGGTSSVTVRVLGTNGQTVADGTAVALAASVGTLSPASASTAGGAVTATYTAPAGVPNTSVTLRATAGAASNTTGVSITCAQTTAPATTQPSAPPPAYAPLPPTGLVISPPNTGDGGLLVSQDVDSD